MSIIPAREPGRATIQLCRRALQWPYNLYDYSQVSDLAAATTAILTAISACIKLTAAEWKSL